MTPREYHEYICKYLSKVEIARKKYGSYSVDSYIYAKDKAQKYMSDYKTNILKEKYLSEAVLKDK